MKTIETDALRREQVLRAEVETLNRASLELTAEVELRRRIEEALRDSEQRYRDLVHDLPAAVYTTDAQGHITLYNEAAVALWGHAPKLGHTTWCGSYRIYRPDGSPLPLDECPLAIALQEGRPIHGEEILIERPDGTRRSVLAHPKPIRNITGAITGAINMLVDITERKRAESALRESEERMRLATQTGKVGVWDRRAEDALRESDRRKDEFLATLAHELRNPLAPIRNGLQIMRLANGNRSAEEQARSMIERQVQQMVRLIDDLLDVSRISRGKVELRKEQVDLPAVLQSAVETSLPLIEQFGHDLVIDVPREPLPVYADMTRLAQVFANLLNNAAKYTERSGIIRLGVERQESEVVITVRDNGVGIPPPMLPHVFEMFTQVDRRLERSKGGLGIGLSIVKQLVEMHGGGVSVRSDGFGAGSEFTVRLPLLSAPPVEASPPPDDGRRPAPSGRRRILVADDNIDAASSLAVLLEMMGNDVRTAHDGLETVDVAAGFRPDVIFLDIGMPKLSGYDACRRIRAQTHGVGTFIVALTGLGQEEDKLRSREAGFDHHLVKPVEPTAVETLLASLRQENHR